MFSVKNNLIFPCISVTRYCKHDKNQISFLGHFVLEFQEPRIMRYTCQAWCLKVETSQPTLVSFIHKPPKIVFRLFDCLLQITTISFTKVRKIVANVYDNASIRFVCWCQKYLYELLYLYDSKYIRSIISIYYFENLVSHFSQKM